jgi:uncharacterized protein YkwD
MRKQFLPLLFLTLLLTISLFPLAARADSLSRTGLSSDATDLIAAVNALRAQHGLNPLQPNSILMQVAQAQADYELTLRGQTDVSADGLRPYQRALLAGYLLAGNLDQGGDYAELLFAGVGVSAADAVPYWSSEKSLLDQLLLPVYTEAGVGFARSGNASYFVLDIAHSTGGTPVAWTPPAFYHSPTPTIAPSTPNPDGSIVHTVRYGDTLGSISLAYDVSIDTLMRLNNLQSASQPIIAGRELLIRVADTPTPIAPTDTPTILPTITSWPTATSTVTDTPLPPATATRTPAPALTTSAATRSVGGIVGAALVIAALVAIFGRKRKK